MVSMVEPTQHSLALPDGSMLAEYRIERVLGVSGFGITYLATDPDNGRALAIEEYLPNDIARRQGSSVRPRSTAHDGEFRRGREQFLDTARALIETRHPNLVPAAGVFEAHNTAYFVMEHDVGERLDVILARHERDFDESELRRMMLALVDGLEALGAVAAVHGGIEPACIQLRPDGAPVLMNLAVSRAAAGRKGRTIAIGLAPGYAAIEQYTGRAALGAHTDIYALGAVLYRIVTGRDPLDAPARVLEDEQVPASRLAVGRYSRKFLRAIDGALAVRPEDRPQSFAEWRELLAAPAVTERPAPAPGAAAAKADKPKDGELRAERDEEEDVDWEPAGGFWREWDWGRFIPYGIGAAATAGAIALLVSAVGSDRYRDELAAGREASERLMQERLAEAERILAGRSPAATSTAPAPSANPPAAPPPDAAAQQREEAAQRQQAEARAAEEQRQRDAAAQRDRQQAEARTAEERRQREVAAQQERERQQAEARAAEERRQREVAAQQERERQQAEVRAAEERRQREVAAQQERERQQAQARAAEEQRQREAAAQRDRERQQAEARAAEERRQREVAAQQERERQQAQARAAEQQRQREVAAQQERERQQAQARAAEEQRQRELAAQQERERQQAQARAAEEQRQRELAAQQERERQQAQARAAEEQRQRELAAARERLQADPRAAMSRPPEERAREAAEARQRELASAGSGASGTEPQSGRLLGTIGPGPRAEGAPPAVTSPAPEPSGIPLRADPPEAAGAAPSSSRIASATGAPMRLSPPTIVAPPANAAPRPAPPSRSTPIALPPAGGAKEIGAVADVNVGWGYVVLQVDPGTVRPGDRIYARSGIERLWMTVRRVNGTQVSATTNVDLRRFTSDLRVYKD